MADLRPRVALIGGGNMAQALLAGLLAEPSPACAPEQLTVVEPDPARAAEVRARFGVEVAEPLAAVRAADTVVLLVKPHLVDLALAQLDAAVTDEHLLVSAAGGVTIGHVEARLSAAPAVVRCMPNTAASVGLGMTAISAGTRAGPEHLDRAEELLRAVGQVVRVPESQLDAVTALSGGGPAYFFLLAEAMVDAGVLLGLPRPLSERLVLQTAAGAGLMLHRSDQDAAALRAQVCSPGGTTIAAIQQLERGALRATVMAAACAARDRSAELGAS